eukprot:Phypoly_transcript_09343.p1 GENE.Phypoly_transcript_09343~~Phypoly_transcript_09343.p1  ORF type:complete len:455 (+),score=107.63 Phypoly_transcript_09343:57-1367(+)
MNSDDAGVVRAAVRHFKSRLFNPMIRPFYKYTLLGLLVLIVACFVYWMRVVNSSQLLVTLLLCVPLAFSFGFFLKPITSYHFQSNFTYYFGVATSFLLASGFSELRVTAYLILNELFNLCGFLFRHYLSSASFAPYVGLLLSLSESLYYETNRSVRRFTSLLHLLLFLFLTFPSLFPEINGFNLCAFAIYLSIPYVLILTLADFTLRASRALPLSPSILSLLTASLTSVLLLLHNCSPLVALVNFQARQILPCLFGKAHFAYDAVRGYAASHRGLQACAIYVLQQAFWVTWFVWGLTPDLDIDPRAGVAGIHNWNEHPVIAGFLLGLQKLGVFPLLALHIGALVIPNLFPLFLYFALTLVNCFSIHMCFKKFQFKTQIETLMILTLCTFIQFILVILVKFGAKPEFEDRSPWGFHVVNRMSNIAQKITSKCRRARR